MLITILKDFMEELHMALPVATIVVAIILYIITNFGLEQLKIQTTLGH